MFRHNRPFISPERGPLFRYMQKKVKINLHVNMNGLKHNNLIRRKKSSTTSSEKRLDPIEAFNRPDANAVYADTASYFVDFAGHLPSVTNGTRTLPRLQPGFLVKISEKTGFFSDPNCSYRLSIIPVFHRDDAQIRRPNRSNRLLTGLLLHIPLFVARISDQVTITFIAQIHKHVIIIYCCLIEST